MREKSNEVLSKTPLMTKTTLSKKVTAPTEAETTYPIHVSDGSKATFAFSQATVTISQSKLSKKIPTFYIHFMRNFLSNCIASLVASNRSQNPNFKTSNGFIKQLMATFVLGWLLLGANTTVSAQTNTNCFGPYSPAPAKVWGIAEKFASNTGIWNGGTPTAADLNGDGISELLVPASDQSGYYVYKGDGSNKTTATKDYVISNTGRYKSSQPAVANIITATSTPEVVMINKTGFVYIFDNVGGSETNYLYKSTSATQYLTNGTPYIVDIDQDGTAEIVVGSDVFGIVNGALVKRVAGPALNYLDGNTAASSGSALDVVVVDIITSNPGKELVYGSRVYSIDLTAGTMSILKDMKTITGFTTIVAGDNGPTAVADMDLDGDLDIVYNGSSKLYVWDPNSMQVLFNKVPSFFNLGFRGLPMIANVYNEKANNGKTSDLPEIVMVTSAGTTAGALTAYNLNFPNANLWFITTDDMSGSTGLTAFDFDGNGIREIVYRDQSQLRIINGNLAAPVDYASIPCTSGTWGEYPIVGDFDNDNEADIAVTGDNKLRVFNRAANTFKWKDAPSYWNQRNYRIVNINPDLTIPTTENNAASSASINNNVAQLQFTDAPVGSSVPYGHTALADAIITITSVSGPCPVLTLAAVITNNGAAPLAIGTPIAIYDGNPTSGSANLVGTYITTAEIAVGATLNVTIPVNLVKGVTTVFAVVNDNGTTARPYAFATAFPNSAISECDYTNNMASNAVVCIDSDTDGINDIVDIDDDNDGILDDVESPDCFIAVANLVTPLSVSSELTKYTSGYEIENVIDASLTTPAGFTPSQNWVGKEIFKFTAKSYIAITGMTFNLINWPISNTANDKFKLQGSSDNISWTDLSVPLVSLTGTGQLSIPNTLEPNTKFLYFRVIGVSGISYYSTVSNAVFNLATTTTPAPIANCTTDTDSDGILNHLDLDSDGDGCSDASEAKTTNVLTNEVVDGPYGANGFADSIETATESNVYNGTYTYIRAINATILGCTDTDGDGIANIEDIDDDNDGVLDVSELTCTAVATNATCLATPQAFGITTHCSGWNGFDYDPSPAVTVITNFDYMGLVSAGVPYFDFQGSVASSASTVLCGKMYKDYATIPGMTYTFSVNLISAFVDAEGIKPNLKAVDATTGLELGTTYLNGTGARSVTFVAIGTTTSISVGLDTRPSLTYVGGNQFWSEAGFTMNGQAYQICTVPDTDSDGTADYLDLDSDGDGCSDAIEAASSTTATSTTVYLTGTDTNTNGLLNNYEGTTAGTINYASIYSEYAIDQTKNACLDTDGDGITDLVDIDDDNDGVLDAQESICAASLMPKTGITVTSPATWIYYNGATSLQGLVDGVDGTTYVASTAATFTNQTILQFDLPVATILTEIELGNYPAQTALLAGGTFKMQGWNGTQWNDIVGGQQVIANTTPINASNNSIKFYMENNLLAFTKYRIFGISASGSQSANELYFTRKICPDIDTDNDGIPNRLELDSDNDGCSDAKEVGTATSTTSATGVVAAPYGTNGFANSLETAADNGIYTGFYAYDYASNALLNSCADTDGDGIEDLIDLDDDNDGVLDATELACSGPQQNTSKTGVIVTKPATINYTFNSNTLANLVDGVDANVIVISAPTGTLTNSPLLNFEFPTPKALRYLEIGHYQGQTLFSTTSTYKIQGSTNNITWTDVTGTLTYNNVATSTSGGLSTHNSNIANFPSNTTAYKYYRVFGLSATSGGTWATEVYFKENTCLWDSDGDGVLNHLDLDSDGDGCADAIEAGTAPLGTTAVTATSFFNPTTTGANGFANNLETATESGLYNGTYSYNLATDVSLVACTDTDGDGIKDVVDLDDDNDGVLDVTELACAEQIIAKTGVIVTKPTTINYTFNGNTIANLIDGVDANVYVASGPTGTLTNSPLLNFEFPTPKALRYLEIGHYVGQTLFSTTSTYKIQGSTDNTTWTDVTGTLTYNNNATSTSGGLSSNNSNIANFPTNTNAYKFYRVFGINAASGGGWATEIYFRENVCNWDIDNDGIENHLDLDADGDGCADAIEAGSSTTATSTTVYPTGTDTNTNGLLNDYEGTTYASTYVNYALNNAINACTDTDNDGVGDLIDLDDDNDGVLDVSEQTASCSSVTLTPVSATSSPVYGGNTANLTIDNSGITGSGLTATHTSPATLDNAWILKEPLTSGFIEYIMPANSNVGGVALWAPDALNYGGGDAPPKDFTVEVTYNDGLTYTSPVYTTAQPNSDGALPGAQPFYFPQALLNVTKIKLNILNGWYDVNNNSIGQISTDDATVNAAYNMFLGEFRAICGVADLDTDGDGIPNRLDLDSDGDGCSDAIEAGSSTTATSTSSYPTGTDSNNNGLLNNYEGGTAGTTNYTSTYTNYALSTLINACLDTDNDGIKNLVDIDDDNDGVLDTVECPLTQLNTNESNGTFGTAAAPRNLANTAVTGGYVYSGSNTGASQYAIINQTTAFFTAGPGFWGYPGHTTGTATDAYLAVNGNTTVGNFYSESVTLQAGAKYRISFWHQAASAANDYQLAAEVLSSSNAVLATANTGAQNSLGWKLTSVDYTSTSTQTVTFIIKNVSTNASGNDFSIDDISFTAIGCPDNDLDGIPNQLDLDSDNDGCSDANEAYNNITAQGTDGNSYYGTGNPPAVNTNGSVTGATYPGTNAAVTTAGSASTITTQPTDQTVTTGATATFTATVTAGSGTTSYQWQVSTNGGSTWTNVTNAGVYSGATTATLTLTGVTSSMNEYKYRLQIAQSNYACGNLTTDAVRLILSNNPKIINNTATVAEGTTLTGNVLTDDTGSGTPAAALTVTTFTVGGVTYNAGDTATIPGVGTLVINSNGSYTFVPETNYNGQVPAISYTATDTNGGSGSGTLGITVTPVNDAPVAANETTSTPQDTPKSGSVLTNDTDADGDTLSITTFTIGGVTYNAGDTASIPGVGTIVVRADGTYTFTPAFGYVGAVPAIGYAISDGNGGTTNGSLTLSVTDVNDAPLAAVDIATTTANTPKTGNVLTNDTDVEGNTLTVTQFTIAGVTGTFTAGQTATIPGVGTIVVNTDGSYTFTPATGFTGDVPLITYTVSDGNSTDTADIDIYVAPVNQAPTATPDTKTVNEDSVATGNVLGNDTDTDAGTTLTVTEYSFTIGSTVYSYPAGSTAVIPGVGTIVVNADGSYTFTPNANYSGAVPVISYTITDSDGSAAVGATATSTLTIAITAVNDTPVAVNDDNITTPEDTPINGNVLSNDTDPEGNPITVTQFTIAGVTGTFTAGQTATIPNVGTVVVNADGTFTFTPVANYNGTVPTITYTIEDINGGTDTANLNLEVTPVNDDPNAVVDVVSISEGTAATGNVLTNDTDPDGNTLSVVSFTINGITYPAGSIVTLPGVGTLIVKADGTYTFTPNTGYFGTVPSIDYTISDGNGGTDSAALNITVTAVNDAPVVAPETVSTPEDTPKSGNVLTNDTDPETDPLTVTNFTVGGVTYNAGQTATIPGVGTIVVNTDGSYTFTPAANYHGVVPVIGYTVSDGVLTSNGALNISVASVNDAPTATNETATTPQNTPVSGSVVTNDTDVDGDTLTVTQFTIAGVTGTFNAGDTATIPGVGTLVVNADGTYTFTPATNYYGPVPVTTYTVTDGTTTATGTLTLAVTPVDTDGDGVMDFQELLDTTDPNDPCAYTLASQVVTPTAAWAALDCDGDGTPNGTDTAPMDPCVHAVGAVPNTTNALWQAADCDNDGESNGTEISNNTNPNNACSFTVAPTASSPAYSTWSALDCDGDGTPNGTDTAPLDPCVHAVGATPVTTNAIWRAADCDNDGQTNGTETTNSTDPNNACSYTVAPSASSPAYSTWATLDCDGDGTPNGTDTAPLNPCIHAVGATPVTTNAIWRAADCDNDGQTNGTETTNSTDPNNPCSYTVAPSASSSVYNTWSALDCDGDGITNGTEITNGTNPLNPDTDGDGNPDNTDTHPLAPTATNDTASVNSGSSVVVNILTNDDYLANDGNTITKTGGTATGTVTFDPVTGTMTYVPTAAESGTTVTVTYRVCQGAVCATATVTITVVSMDDDGDGVSNAQEAIDGTDPNNSCDYNATHQLVSITTAAWKAADCDGDGTPNGTDTKPLDPCVNSGTGTPDVTNTIWATADCDNDGIPNAIDGVADTDGDGIPNYKDLDSDGDGIPDSIEDSGCTGTSPCTPTDTDGDGTPNFLDLDSDGDGISDNLEDTGCTGTAPCIPTDTDGDGTPNYLDLDSDGDGIPDAIEKGTGAIPVDTDGDGTPDYKDLDSDNDGILDSVEKGPNGATPVDTDGDGTPDYNDLDSDGDGKTDAQEGLIDTDSDGTPNYLDLDSDGDGVLDNVDQCPLIVGTAAANGCPADFDNDGIDDAVDLDDDNDGILDTVEAAACTPADPNCDTDGDGIPNRLDSDSDNDGISDVKEAGGIDTDFDGRVDGAVDANGVPVATNGGLTPPNTDGTGASNPYDVDSDGDGISDAIEKGPNGNNPVDTDGDGTPDYLDLDSDNDGIPDAVEKGPGATPLDTDGDGIPDYKDTDSDNDGILDNAEDSGCTGTSPCTPTDTDGDGTPDYRDLDSDNDGILDSVEKGTGTTPVDTDGDGTPDYRDLDSDNDGILDSVEKGTGTTPIDTDGDGTPDYRDLDSDNDGILDSVEKGIGTTPIDTDGDGTPDYQDTDSDNDGILDSVEKGTGTTPIDTDGDGTPDYRDTDSDNDGILDSVEKGTGTTPVDTDGDGTPDYRDLDSDNDGILDSVEKGTGTTPIDTDGDGIPDYRDTDSDNDGILDSVEKGTGTTPIDTDGDGIPDYRDTDSDNDGILDSVEKGTGTTPIDTDGDGIPDYRDLDSDNDGILDSVEKGPGATPLDTDGDGIPDYRDTDSDNDGILDSVEKGTGTSPVDTDGDGTPDYRDLDSDGDGKTDAQEGTIDTDGDGTPNFLDLDSDGDGVLDSVDQCPLIVGTAAANGCPADFDGDGIDDVDDLDDDNDGILDTVEAAACSPADPNCDTDGDGIPNRLDSDSDNDGISDVKEAGGTDSNGDGKVDGGVDANGVPLSTNGGLTPPNTDGTGASNPYDVDSDGDGISDAIEKGANGNNPVDTDGDGTPDYLDLDSDNDGISDAVEKGPGATPLDTDGDGIADYKDLDSDNDGIPDAVEKGTGTTPVDTDNDGTPDYRDTDSDNDGILDSLEDSACIGTAPCTPTDTDGDGTPDYRDLDSDNDGITDAIEKGTGTSPVDTDGDGTPDYRDLDSDNDGILDSVEKGTGTTPIDTDGDGTPDYQDLDSDNDGILDSVEKGPGTTPIDTDGDGTPDYRDLDSDNDGIPDAVEKGTGVAPVDTDGDGIPDYRDLDSDNDGITDAIEKGTGSTPLDTDGDGTPDYRDLDSDGDGKPDAQEGNIDTDGDGTPNFQDLDSDGDGVVDSVDQCPLVVGTAAANGCPADFDGDGFDDVDDLDDDNDGILDTVEAAACSPADPNCDTDGDGIPNRLDSDSDNDGISDVKEAGGTDTNNDGKVDGGVDANGVPLSTNGGLTPPNTDGTGGSNPYDIDSDGDGIPDSIEKGANGNNPVDTDGDGTPDYLDLDSDGDGISDAIEKGSSGTTPLDTDGDGTPDYRDLDSDNDGIPDAVEKGTGTTPIDTDGDGTPDFQDVDSDNDGILDAIEKGPNGATPVDTDNDGTPDYRDLDSDNDGILDSVEKGPGSTPVDTDGDGTPDFQDLDSDGDGISDAIEKGTGTTPVDTDGDGIPDYRDLDSDNDGISDAIEKGPTATPVDTDGDGTPDYRDLDSDNDGIPDSVEKGPNASPVDTDNDGTPDFRDLDSDNDGIPDNQEGVVDTDLDGTPDYRDLDSDGDGVLDANDMCPLVVGTSVMNGCPADFDGDGIDDVIDLDDDNDGILDTVEAAACSPVDPNCDTDGDGIPNRYDADSDNDGIKDTIEAGVVDANNDGKADGGVDADGVPLSTNGGKTPPDTDGDGQPNPYDVDSDGDGISDAIEKGANGANPVDTDGDGTPDYLDLDSDNDGIPDAVEKGTGASILDTDGDGTPDYRDLDSDNDGIPDSVEKGPNGATPLDTDNDGTPDYRDLDSDNDGISDAIEKGPTATPVDTDLDGTPDYRDLDSDNDGIPDAVEKGTGTTPVDTDGDGTPDYRDLDSDNDGILDATEKGPNGATPLDTDNDGTPDYRDLDSDNDGISDAIEKGPTATPIDTDLDGTPDYQDLDSDNDGISDAIEKGIDPLHPVDTDGDGTPDYLDLDSDNDGIPDAVEKGPGATPVDTDGDGTPDYRDLDSDNDGITDAIEKGANGATPVDTDSDGIPDYRDLDSDGDNKPDNQEGLTDTDGDGLPNYRDIDSDNDGVLDVNDQCPYVEGTAILNGCPPDSDNDGITDNLDLDDDNDGILDTVENGICSPASTNCDTDGDGIPNRLDPDSDNDGISDVRESNGTDTNGDGKVDGPVDSNGIPQSSNGGVTPPNTDGDANPNPYDLDSDGDGISDAIEKGANGNAPVDTDGDGTPDYLDLDSDNDGIPDTVEKGTGTSILDTDGDGTPDYRDLDSDNDGIPDAVEKGPNGATPIDTDGDGTPDYRDMDSDNDGILDAVEKGTNGNLPVDTDGDGTPDYRDIDSDGDGVRDIEDDCPLTFGTAALHGCPGIDSDNDGIPDAVDLDDDNDGITDVVENAACSPSATNCDSDGDGIINSLDLDSDNDGITDARESNGIDADSDGRIDGPVDANGVPVSANGGVTPPDTDGDGKRNPYDVDSDGDGIPDSVEKGATPNAPVDTDGDGTPDYLDLDSDNDGIPDAVEKGPNGATPLDTDNDGTPDYRDLDSDNDGIPDAVEKGPNGATPLDTDNDGTPDYRDIDSDNDGIPDAVEKGSGSTPIDTDGDGTPDYRDLDSDNDGIPDAVEKGPNGATPLDTDGDGTPDYRDLDSDNDGISDAVEKGPNGATPLDTDNDGTPDYLDLDSDNDGIPDAVEKGPNGATPLDTDNDGTPDYRDLDSDNDGIPDAVEKGPNGAAPLDTDNDGTPDYLDLDSDNDGIPDAVEKGPNGATPLDTDNDGTPDYRDLDSDNDGIPDAVEKGPNGATPLDTDNDGTPDYRDLDSDNDGIPDAVEKGPNGATPLDTDNDGTPDYRDLDSDNDGIPDAVEKGPNGATPLDTDNDGTPDYLDLDSDNDGIPDAVEKGPNGATPLDTDNDGTPDYRDLDSDNDGIPDAVEKGPNGATPLDTDNDGTPDYLDLDSDNDGIPDAVEKGPNGATPLDTDNDGTPDYRDLDSDNDGIPDAVEKGPNGATPLDTDNDGTPDYLDLDSDNDGIPDSVEKGPNGATPLDTDNDGTLDYRDLDSDNDGIPDAVEKGPNGATPLDTDNDGTPDYRDLDSDNDGIPDAVEKGPNGATPLDTDNDGTPDYRDLDSDNDGISDAVEKGTNGNSPIDTDGDGIPDYRDLPTIPIADTDGDGVTDSQEAIDGTDPNNACDSVPAHVTLPFSASFLSGDCDSDGLTNALELGTNPTLPTDIDNNGTPDYLEFNNHSQSEDELEIFNSMTNNGDALNDVFVIRGIENYPDNTLTIYNRWGVEVYNVEGYGQDDKYFRGLSEGRKTISQSAELPKGTYFYILRYVNKQGVEKERSGYLYITK